MLQTAYLEPGTFNSNALSVETSLYEQYQPEFEDDEKLYSQSKNSNLQSDISIGSSLNWGKIIFNTFTNGLNSFSITPSDFDTELEQAIATLLVLFRSLMYVLMVFEAYLIFKNRKG